MYHILIVDNSPSNITTLKDILHSTYHISTATSGEQALKAIEKDPPDMILLDTMMPEMDGYQVCKRLKACEATATIPIIFVTTKTEIVDEQKGFDMGAVDYIAQPSSPLLILTRIKNHLKLRHMRDLLQEATEHSIKLRRKMSEFEIRNKMNQFHLQSPEDTSKVLMVSLPMGRS